jgi:phosphoglycolate phosphatase
MFFGTTAFVTWYNVCDFRKRGYHMKQGVIFDMDGTILDTIEDIKDSMNHALQRVGFPKRTTEEMKMAVGNAAMKSIERSVPEYATNQDIQLVYDLFQSHYDKNSANKTKPYDGIMELLGTLKRRGYKLAVVSNKHEYLVKELNERMFMGLFDVSVGATPERAHKPAPDMVYKALEELDLGVDDVLFIGDSDIDIQTAKRAGIRNIGVTWGFRSREVLIKEGADAIVDRVDELIPLIEGDKDI